jgi:hypothetical protein
MTAMRWDNITILQAKVLDRHRTRRSTAPALAAATAASPR